MNKRISKPFPLRDAEHLGYIKVAAKQYDIYVVDELPAGESGVTDTENGTIVITMAGKSQMQDTLMHETLHAIIDAYGISHILNKAGMNEEDLVYALTPALLATLNIKIPVLK